MKRLRCVLPWLPAAVWYGVIWNFSAQTAEVSGGLSDWLLGKLLGLISPAFASSSGAIQAAAVEMLSFFERKAAHMFLYFTLVLFLWLAVRHLLAGSGRQMLLAAALCALLAGADEYHQTFIPGRSGEFRDVCVDMTGALLSLTLAGVLLWAARQRRRGVTWRWPWVAAGLAAAIGAGLCAAVRAGWILSLPDAALAAITLETAAAVSGGALGAAGVLALALSPLPPRRAGAAALAVGWALTLALIGTFGVLAAAPLAAAGVGWGVGIVLWAALSAVFRRTQ